MHYLHDTQLFRSTISSIYRQVYSLRYRKRDFVKRTLVYCVTVCCLLFTSLSAVVNAQSADIDFEFTFDSPDDFQAWVLDWVSSDGLDAAISSDDGYLSILPAWQSDDLPGDIVDLVKDLGGVYDFSNAAVSMDIRIDPAYRIPHPAGFSSRAQANIYLIDVKGKYYEMAFLSPLSTDVGVGEFRRVQLMDGVEENDIAYLDDGFTEGWHKFGYYLHPVYSELDLEKIVNYEILLKRGNTIGETGTFRFLVPTIRRY